MVECTFTIGERQMIKQKEKGLALGLILALAALTIYCGFLGWRVYFLPMQYVGYVLAVIGIAGLAGVNIWVGPFEIEPEDKQENERGTIS